MVSDLLIEVVEIDEQLIARGAPDGVFDRQRRRSTSPSSLPLRRLYRYLAAVERHGAALWSHSVGGHLQCAGDRVPVPIGVARAF